MQLELVLSLLSFLAPVAILAVIPRIPGLGREDMTVTRGTTAFVRFALPALDRGTLVVLGPASNVLFTVHTTDPNIGTNVTSWRPPPRMTYDSSESVSSGYMSFSIEDVQGQDAGVYLCIFVKEDTGVVHRITDCGQRVRVRNCTLYQ